MPVLSLFIHFKSHLFSVNCLASYLVIVSSYSYLLLKILCSRVSRGFQLHAENLSESGSELVTSIYCFFLGRGA